MTDWCDQIVGDEGDQRLVSDDSDLVTISDKLKLLSINKETVGNSANEKEEFLKSDEELARMLQVFCFDVNLVFQSAFDIQDAVESAL